MPASKSYTLNTSQVNDTYPGDDDDSETSSEKSANARPSGVFNPFSSSVSLPDVHVLNGLGGL